MWSFFSNARSEINGPWSGPKKSPPQKTSEVDTNYDCRQGNKWDHQLGCEFQSSRYVNLCLKGALINYLLIYLIYTQRACGARVASVRLTYARENVFIVIARACIAYLSRSTHSVTWSAKHKGWFPLLRKFYVRAGVHLTGFTCVNKIRDDEWTAYVNVRR